MLVQLAIRDIVLIDRLELDFGPGLTVLTGETGAGKSILLDAFSLALGGRGDGALVRSGQGQGQVIAVFDPPPGHPARLVAAEQGLDVEGDLILRRVQMADGRSRAFVNDQPVSIQALRAVGDALVEIHGQHDDRVLVDPNVHRALLDAFGGHGDLVARTRAAHAELREANQALRDETAAVEAARKEADYLSHAHEELAKLGPRAGEEEELAAERTAMQQAEKVAGDLRDAQDSVSGDGSPLSTLSSALRRLERRQPQAPHLIEPALKALDAALTAFDLAQQALDQALRDAEFDPRALEQVEERLFALRAASRKYSTPADGLAALAEKFAADLAALDAGEARLVALAKACEAAEVHYRACAADLTAVRKKAARALDAAVNAELPPLKLERAVFSTQIVTDESQAGPDGAEKVEFWVQTNPGSRPGPLMKVASGGELSRFMLALKVALADRGSAPTLVFDEIDSGAGGAAADAIGQRLARLGANVQVLSVTHAPQVAARATTHMRISKDLADKGARAATRVAPLADEHRREEIARMLAGATITEEARAAAARLIENAR
ncbi:DNA repair protein RecN [Rhodoblastus acidophilus]|uniref:DNA repair protein RecN n=1 Tax=Candidatus Rhodoblastus alkanivorans TaxID=2954117 RepID=A0ABS9Z8N5_9HYPH|nr:DNA repair protein RecN [Candidatus Rhodoblastus alkanivorans]MCI4679507.1 DNA repair protein RecN [Candidatus Rhodoblastus alkanivorans]MCI4683952.1 DNA repair protein RecN [Candidatus Rhodoblastus alkanivorans]MDI4641271.1 DNA repair protein RecN [Rhodoblastus acidophilus]